MEYHNDPYQIGRSLAVSNWALTEAQGAQLETFHNGSLRQIMGLHCGPDGPSTAELLARTKWE